MKKLKIILWLCIIITMSESNAQPIDSTNSITPKLHSDQLFQKARNQKTTAWIFLAGGAGIAIAGLVVGESTVNHVGIDPIDKIYSDLQTGSMLLLAGGASMLASIPFFVASGKNGRKARITFNNESNSILRQLHHKGNNIIRVGISLNL